MFTLFVVCVFALMLGICCWVFVVCVFTLVLGICCMCVYFSVGYLLYVCLL